ncbi:class I SAM-dependent methyltransferase [Streptomyces cyaneochromogenes]|uniref:Class I SAM-dependent methyltransferase n=1 Tax=Streptomyces cyaneochromogenes TaxID=2496836 RepID=A0A3Q9EW29_9ACTN|nr:class I SAM-dependent methyltransferase [Streptomyces cyaneochromogenes]AZQ37263.1 class I SAM-dependent methyltransferase [Streptomyces cyaneochromogenes]
MPDPYWNHNVHYHRVVLAAVPDGCRAALDVGCGDGLLARKLATKAASVTGVDRSPEMIRQARAQTRGNITFLEADYLDGATLPEGKYDFISAVAVVHHARFEDAVGALVRLLAPGGRLVIVGMAYNKTALDWVISGCGVPPSMLTRWLRGGKRGPAAMPVQDSAMHWGEARRAARSLLPGCRFRRRLLWRYTLEWDAPDTPAPDVRQEGGP